MTQPDNIAFSAVTAADFDELAALRIAAMREGLERVGRFDPERARERLRKSFHPEHTQVIVCEGQRVGFYTFRPADDALHLDHLYLHPDWQSRGIGSRVMRGLLAEAGARQMPIKLGALRGSESNAFYQRHGFTVTSEDEWDIYYLRLPSAQPTTTMKIDGIKGCFEKTRGLFYFARMCSKIRLHAEDRLPAEYHEMLGQGFDGRTCRYLRVRYEDVKAQVLSGKADAEVLDWCFANGRPLTEEEVLIYNSFMSKRGWHDDETDEFIPEMIQYYGLPDNGTVLTDFDLIEMDEGRWYPDMWRDAWKK